MSTENIQYEAAILMRERRFDEAAQLLSRERDGARQRNNLHDASEVGTFLAACLMAGGKNEQALKAYEEAEADRPDDPFLKYAIANFLVTVMNRSAEALPRLLTALPHLQELKSSHHAALGLLGLIYARQNRFDEAVRLFQEMTKDEFVMELDSSGFDLNLVEALIRNGKIFDECSRYLSVVESKSAQQNDREVANKVQYLREQIRELRGG